MMSRLFKIGVLLFLVLELLAQCYPSQHRATKPVRQESAFRFYENALIAKFDGHWQQALDEVNRAIAINPHISLFYVLKGQVFDSLTQVDSAISAYKQALKIRPHAPDILQKIGALYVKKGQPLTGIVYFKKAFAYAENQTEILLRMAKLYIRLDSLKGADDVLTDYKIRMDLERRSPNFAYYLLKADLALARKNLALAAQYYAACPCKKCFSHEELIHGLETLYRTKRYDDYFALLTGADQHKFRDGELFYYRGLYYRVIGNVREAQHQFELALKHGSLKPDLFLQLAQIYYQEKQTGAIKALSERLKKIAPNSPVLEKIRALY